MGSYVHERCLNDQGYLELSEDTAVGEGLGAIDPLGTIIDTKTSLEARAAKAKVWVGKYLGNKNVDALTQFAAEYAYGEGAKFVDELKSNPVVARVLSAGGAVFDIGTATRDLVVQYKKGPPDAAGILAWKQGIDKLIGGGIALAEALGADSSVMAEVSTWTGIGTVCASSITAGVMGGGVGVVAGAAVCAGAVLVQALKYIVQPTPEDDRKADQYPAIFAPNEYSNPQVQRDGARLAGALAYWYGMDSVASVYSRLKAFTGRWESAPRPTFDPKCEGKAVTGSVTSKPIPAVDAWAALVALDFSPRMDAEPATAPLDNTRNGLFSLLKVVRTFETSSHLTGLAMRHLNHHDISATVIRVAAILGRTAVTQVGKPHLTLVIEPWGRDVDLYALAEKWVDEGVRDGWVDNKWITTDLTPFIRLDELINLFVAIGERERTAGSLRDVVYAYGQSLPIRWYGVLGGQGDHYYDRKWTNAWPAMNSDELIPKVLTGDAQACRELAFIRVLSAFSYLVTMYHWTNLGTCGEPFDAIRVAANEPDPMMRRLASPIDPRGYNRNPRQLDPEEQVISFPQSWVSWDGGTTIASPVVTQVPGTVTGLVGKPTSDPIGIGPAVDGWLLAQKSPEESFLEQVMRDARAAGVDSAYHDGTLPCLGQPAGLPAGTAPVFETMAQPKFQLTASSIEFAKISPVFDEYMSAGLIQRIGVINPIFEQNCIANGGEAYLDASGLQKCRPTTQGQIDLESRCRECGGTPVWEEGQMRCLPPPTPTASGGGSLFTLLALAGLGYLLYNKYGK